MKLRIQVYLTIAVLQVAVKNRLLGQADAPQWCDDPIDTQAARQLFGGKFCALTSPTPSRSVSLLLRGRFT